MFEFVTEYNKEIFCKCYKVYYKVFCKYNAKIAIPSITIGFVVATILLILGILKPETFKTIYASVFFYILTLLYIIAFNNMTEKGIKRIVDKNFNKNPNLNVVIKHVFNDDKFLSISSENNTKDFEYTDIIHFEVQDGCIIILLKNKKFVVLNTNDEKVIKFLKSKITIDSKNLK